MNKFGVKGADLVSYRRGDGEGCSVSSRVELREVSLETACVQPKRSLCTSGMNLCSHVRNFKSGFCANKNLHPVFPSDVIKVNPICHGLF